MNKILITTCLCLLIAGQAAESQNTITQTTESSSVHEFFGHYAQQRPQQLAEISPQLRSSIYYGHSRLDSLITYYTNDLYTNTKSVYRYNGDTIIETSYIKDNNGKNWIFRKIDGYAFDDKGNLTLDITTYGNEDDGIKEECAYNSNNTSLYERSYCRQDGKWILKSDITYIYDENGMLAGGNLLQRRKDRKNHSFRKPGTHRNAPRY